MEQIERTLTSMEVAEMVEKDHSKLLRDIRAYSEQLAEAKIGLGDFFTESTYQDANNQTRPCYNITKKGCEFIAHKLTGVKGTAFTAKYINRFHDMEDAIHNVVHGDTSSKIRLLAQGYTEIEQRVDKLENTMNVDYAQQKQLKNLANEVVVGALGGKGSRAYRYIGEDNSKISSQCFSRFWHDFNDYFNINAYANLQRIRFNEALEYINKWQPPTNMQLQIGRINREVA